MGSYNRSSDYRMEEKQDMIRQNDMLANYIQRVRQLGTGGADSAAFRQTLDTIEQELAKQKAMYERELEKCRQQLADSNHQKNDALSEIEKHKRCASDFQDRYKCESEKNAKVMNDIACLQRKIADLERELQSARSEAQSPKMQLSVMENDLAKEQAKNKDLARALDTEKNKSKQLEDKVNDLENKVGFNDKVMAEQNKDLQNRLDQAKKVISDLERKNNENEREQGRLPQLLQEMRQKADKDLKRFKDDAEAQNKKNNETIKKQLDDQNRTIEQLRADNNKLENANVECHSKIRTLEAQIKELNCQKAALENQIAQERAKNAERLKDQEKKLKDLNDTLLAKMQEVNAGKDAECSLRREIDEYKALLEAENSRLEGTGTGTMNGMGTGTGTARYGLSSPMGANKTSTNAYMGKTGSQTNRDFIDTARRSGQWTFKGPQTEYDHAYNLRSGYTFHVGDENLRTQSPRKLDSRQLRAMQRL